MTYEIKEIADCWEKISEKADAKSNGAKDEFQKRALLVGGLAVISGSAITAFNGGLLSQAIAVGSPLSLMAYASLDVKLKESFYDSMSAWALNKRDNIDLEADTKYSKKPRFDEEEINFQKHYKAPSIIKNFMNFRSVAIAGAVAAAITAFNANQETDTALFDRQRKEGNDNDPITMDESVFAPATSPRPVARP